MMIKYSNADGFYEYFWRPIRCAASYSATAAERIESMSRTREICREAAFALMAAARFIPIDCPDVWMERFRVMRFLDRTDLYLTLLRSDSWLDRWVRIEGAWPEKSPFLGITFHYGTGFWVARHLRKYSIKVNAARARLQRSDFGDNWVRFRYNQLRNWNIDREMMSKAFIVGSNAARSAITLLNSGSCFFGLFDIPAESEKNCLELPFLGRKGRFNRGLISIAKTAKVPIVVYTMRVDADGLTRILTISEPFSAQDEYSAGHAIVSHLEKAVILDSTQWHQWGAVNSFISDVGNDSSGKSHGQHGQQMSNWSAQMLPTRFYRG